MTNIDVPSVGCKGMASSNPMEKSVTLLLASRTGSFGTCIELQRCVGLQMNKGI